MARKAANTNLYRLRKYEVIAGWLYLPVYLVGLNYALQLANEKLALGMTALTMNIVYFAVNFVAVVLIFHNFLRQPFFGGRFWNFVQALVLGFALYYAGTWVLQFALSKLAPGFIIYNNETVSGLIAQSQTVMLVMTVLAAPIIEETLVRGLVFGSIRDSSRVMAYIVSVLLFTLMHNWQYFLLYPAGKVLLSCIPYLPASVALAWTYEKGGSIWTSISLHAIVNAMSYGLLQLQW